MKIAVLCGGDSPERAVSLRSGARVAAALAARGHSVVTMEPPRRRISADMCRLFADVDAIVLALHGGDGENGGVQSLLERAGFFHYTGSDPEASALAMQKDLAKQCVEGAGLAVACGAVIPRGEGVPPWLKPPLVVKPRAGGSSVGLAFLDDARACRAFCAVEDMLCESFLPGREYSVGILEGQALPPIEIRPRGGVYDYHHKYTAGATEELCPAPLAPSALLALERMALDAFQALGMRDFGRIDFREDAGGRVCFLEANTLPGLAATSLLPLAAEQVGIDFATLCERVAALAARRKI